jgi:DNA-binding transcriptional LysR family regulator
MLRFLAADELDAAFCLLAGEIPDDLAVERLSREEAVAVFAPDRAPAVPRVSVTDLRGQAILATRRGSAITSVLEERFAAAGEPLRLALESGDPFLLRALAARGFATAILPRSLTALEGPALEVRSLEPPSTSPWRSCGGANATPHPRHARSSNSCARQPSPASPETRSWWRGLPENPGCEDRQGVGDLAL